MLTDGAKHWPERLAIVGMECSWTYHELAQHAEAYRAMLVAAGISAGDRVVFRLPNCPEAIALAAACAALRAPFVPLDLHAPEERIALLLEDVEPALIIGEGRYAGAAARGIFNDGKLHIEGRVQRISDTGFEPLYIIFTSGSTGRPKGIMMSEAAVLAFFHGLIGFMQLPESSRYATTSPLHFDYFWLDAGLTLGSGGTLLLLDRTLLRQPRRLVEEIARSAARYVSAVPTVWKMILAVAEDDLVKLANLKEIVFAGEHFPQACIKRLYERLPGLVVTNVYGQSESIACAFQRLPSPLPQGLQHLPVGVGHTEAELFLIDAAGAEVIAPGVGGELHLKGRILFDGYYRNSLETLRRLVPDPRGLDGVVFRSGDWCYFDENKVFYFVGRIDNQVQVAGNRVELGEVEAVLLAHSAVNNVAVIAVEKEAGATLHAFVVSSEGLAENELEEQLRTHSAEWLPHYMRPNRFHLMKSLPLTSNGKTDALVLRSYLNLTDGELIRHCSGPRSSILSI
ncbi:AMP-binding protein [Sulfuricella sp.]|uniref:AMP-binding protein n=1 Tax=Sulfuricella sp. TaxID=2099377 RepID=UPI002C3A37B4|nr:AMP-binding protein [Sulfuricella sp.]HUX63543.1 AMP-binding protein [Sulfuricella sp.]